jgi:hypothetical protein
MERASAPFRAPGTRAQVSGGKPNAVSLGASQNFRIATRGFLYFGPYVYTNCRKDLLAPGASGEAGQGQCETWCCAAYTGCAASCREHASVPFRPRVHALDLWRQAKLFGLLRGAFCTSGPVCTQSAEKICRPLRASGEAQRCGAIRADRVEPEFRVHSLYTVALPNLIEGVPNTDLHRRPDRFA